ncbi:MAG: hypothetical protein IJN67_01535 [Oscillospiraceae bacterium]|nr:hypothetical protein [Oscillospiraceae bacterium]
MSKFKIPILHLLRLRHCSRPGRFGGIGGGMIFRQEDPTGEGKFFSTGRQKVPKGIFDGFFAGFSAFLN